MAGAGVCRRCYAVGAVKTAEVAGARGCSAAWATKIARLAVAGAGVKLIGARRPGEVVEPRRAERGGGDVRSGGDAAAADAANPLWAAVR